MPRISVTNKQKPVRNGSQQNEHIQIFHCKVIVNRHESRHGREGNGGMGAGSEQNEHIKMFHCKIIVNRHDIQNREPS